MIKYIGVVLDVVYHCIVICTYLWSYACVKYSLTSLPVNVTSFTDTSV